MGGLLDEQIANCGEEDHALAFERGCDGSEGM